VKTTRAFEFWHDAHDEQKREVYTVMEGFVSDFASIPRLCWPLIGHPAGEYAQASVLHDFLYRVQPVSRKKADELFLEGMEVLGVVPWKRKAMYAAVRCFAKHAWKNKQLIKKEKYHG